MSQKEQIFTQLEGILLDKFGAYPDDIRLDASIKEDLGMDSLESVELVMECETAFSISIPDEVASKVVTVEDLVGVIDERVVLRA